MKNSKDKKCCTFLKAVKIILICIAVIALIAIIIVLIPVSLATTTTHHQNMSEIAKYDNGSTVFAGDNVIDKNKIDKIKVFSGFCFVSNL